MAQEPRQGRTAAVWAMWLGLLTGMPYALTFHEPSGAVACSGTYGFAALGVLAGLAASNATCVLSSQAMHPKAWRATAACGIVATVLLALAQIFHLFPVGAEVPTGGLDITVQTVLIDIGRVERPVAFLLAFLCILCKKAMTGLHNEDTGTSPNEGFRTERRNLAIVCAAAMCGVTRPFAWLLLFPHPDFPIPVPDMTLSASDQWGEVGMHGSMAVIGCVSLLAHILSRRDQNLLASILGAFAFGEVAMRVAGRLIVDMAPIPLWFACICLGFQTTCLLALVFWASKPSCQEQLAHEPSHGKLGAKEPAIVGKEDEPTLKALMSCIETAELESLVQMGLTPGEINAVRASVLGLNSGTAARLLSLRPSTVRSYRRRICSKLGLKSVEDLVESIKLRQGNPSVADQGPNQPEEAREASVTKGWAALSFLSSGIANALCLLLPAASSTRSWDMLLVFASGVCLGLLLVAAKARFGKARLKTPLAHPKVKGAAQTAALLAAAAMLTFLQFDNAGAIAYSSPCKLGIVVAMGISLAWYATCLPNAVHVVAQSHLVRAYAAAFVGLSLYAATCLIPPIRIAVFACCMFVSIVSFWLLSRGGSFKHRENRPNGHNRRIEPILAMCFCLGFSWEESLRGRHFVSFEAACAAYLAATLAITLYLLRRQLDRRHLAAYLLPALAIGFTAGPGDALLSCYICLVLLQNTAGDRSCDERGPKNFALPYCCIALVAGVGAGYYGTNVFGSYLLGFGYPYNNYLIMLSVATAAVGIALGLAFAYHALSLVGENRMCEIRRAASIPVTPERLRQLFLAKGLDETQANLMVLLSNGSSVAEAARALNYSRGAADVMRRKAFALLGISSKAELVNLLVNEFDRH